MALTEQKFKLRRLLQDLYDRDGTQLTESNRAFQDDELDDLIECAAVEVTEGLRSVSQLTGPDLALVMLVARSDGVLMLAQDEARRKKWNINNKTIDSTETPKRLIEIARELRMRYQGHKDRSLKKELEDGLNRPTGGILRLNDTVPLSTARDFNNSDVRRNKPRR